MPKVLAVETSFPKYVYEQSEISGLLAGLWPEQAGVIARLAGSSGVKKRGLVMPIEQYKTVKGMGERQVVYTRAMLELLSESIAGLKERVSFDWEDIGAIFSTTVTGIAVPSLDARLMNKFPFPTDVVRMPIFGLGCLGGIGTINRACDWLRGHPTKLALVMASEACSLTFQLDDLSMANLIGTHLFGDGVAVLLLAGERHKLALRSGLRVVKGMASFYPDTERVMGWDVVDNGFRIVLSGNVPEIVAKNVAGDLGRFLPEGGPTLDDIRFMVSHPGGPKVLKALGQLLNGRDEMLAHSWASLSEHGNMSSVSVLDVLSRTLAQPDKPQGLGLGIAMGPGFNAEFTMFEAN